MTKHFLRELETIKKMVLYLGSMVEEKVHQIAIIIEDKDFEMAEEIIKTDYKIDEMEVELEEECLMALALYQPVAIDLRFLTAVIKINNDLERIGDQAVNIAQRVKLITQKEEPGFFFDYTTMVETTELMLKQSLDALIRMDIDLALEVLKMDDDVDEIKDDAYDRIKKAITEHPDHTAYLINFLLISRHLERMADHATNIAEEVIYMIEGEIVRHGKVDQ